MNPSIKVFGITPAASVSPNWDLKIVPTSSLARLPELGHGASNLVQTPSSQEYHLGSKAVIINNSDVDSLKDHTNVVVGFGKVMYSDVFGKLRWTEFCWTFDIDFSNANTNANLCPTHNGTDWSKSIPGQVTTVITINVKSATPENLPASAPLPPPDRRSTPQP